MAFFLLYAIWLSFNILRFKTYKAPALKSSPLEIEGVYHIHTTYSDGRKSLDEIAKLASQANIDFIILTDHGRPIMSLIRARVGKKEFSFLQDLNFR